MRVLLLGKAVRQLLQSGAITNTAHYQNPLPKPVIDEGYKRG